MNRQTRTSNKVALFLISLALMSFVSGCEGLLEAGRDYGENAMRERDYRDIGLSSKAASRNAFYDSMWQD